MNNTNNTTHQKDVSLKTFWRDNEHFADLFNATVFNGKQVLKPNKLTEMDTDVSATIQSKSYNESITRNRDVVKKMSDGVEFNILGLEIQDKTHYVAKCVIGHGSQRHGIMCLILNLKTENIKLYAV